MRPGRRGTAAQPGLFVRYSSTLNGNVGNVDGLRVTMPARTVVDVWPLLRSRSAREKLLREALRRQVVSPASLTAAFQRHRGARGIATLRATLGAWTGLPFHRCRSDAEAYALTVLNEYGVEIPLVNSKVGGYEADLVWTRPRRIIEIDGPDFHQDKLLDAIKTAAWYAAGYRVDRLPSDTLFATPETLIGLAPRPPHRRTSVSPP